MPQWLICVLVHMPGKVCCVVTEQIMSRLWPLVSEVLLSFCWCLCWLTLCVITGAKPPVASPIGLWTLVFKPSSLMIRPLRHLVFWHQKWQCIGWKVELGRRSWLDLTENTRTHHDSSFIALKHILIYLFYSTRTSIIHKVNTMLYWRRLETGNWVHKLILKLFR